MTTIKLDGKPSTAAADALTPWAQDLYRHPGMRIVGVVELAHVERTQPAPDENRQASVKLRVAHLELANDGEQENQVRAALRALHTFRTAQGKLTEADDIELSEATLRHLGEDLAEREAARRGIAIDHWAAYATRLLHTKDLTQSELMHEMKNIADGLYAVLHRDRLDAANGEEGTPND